MLVLEEKRQRYARANKNHAQRLEQKSKDLTTPKMLRQHSASLAMAIRLGFATTLDAHNAGFSKELRQAFDSVR